jgi:hypothetical protein
MVHGTTAEHPRDEVCRLKLHVLLSSGFLSVQVPMYPMCCIQPRNAMRVLGSIRNM